MNKKYIRVDFYEVFSDEFMESLGDNVTAANRMNHVLSRIEQYEEKNDAEFVCFYGTSELIFKRNPQ